MKRLLVRNPAATTMRYIAHAQQLRRKTSRNFEDRKVDYEKVRVNGVVEEGGMLARAEMSRERARGNGNERWCRLIAKRSRPAKTSSVRAIGKQELAVRKFA